MIKENYRLMKKWYTLVKPLSKNIDLTVKNSDTTKSSKSSSLTTVTTEDLKAQDWLMKHFVKHKS